jgi:hypothetical protein
VVTKAPAGKRIRLDRRCPFCQEIERCRQRLGLTVEHEGMVLLQASAHKSWHRRGRKGA